ncbi:hypothetical protein [Methylophaga pinxianii]|uniref:hypothetical protein n=1 Tax=Methylophaga pinxianii TaxID=2881052 RepID=UPI001CF30C38|nr:hypothetical protein [Methylophaga pinxianii]MCB2425758.1 hypothetical protein [Methylophaga pinxianii]UPH46985.1 hypothetical protein LGT42_006800 [Methylophaga pinxianii]
MNKRLSINLVSVVLGLIAFPVMALTPVPVPTEPIYYEPPVVDITDEIRKHSCVEIDDAINQLHPYRYSYKPGFSEDGSNKLAATLIVFDTIPIVEGWLGLAYLGYSSLVDEKEARRTQQVEQKISMLQRVKAEKHCFE